MTACTPLNTQKDNELRLMDERLATVREKEQLLRKHTVKYDDDNARKKIVGVALCGFTIMLNLH